MKRNIKELNKRKIYTNEQLGRLARFKDKYIDVYPLHHELWVDGKGYETVYEVRGMSNNIKENFQTVKEILRDR